MIWFQFTIPRHGSFVFVTFLEDAGLDGNRDPARLLVHLCFVIFVYGITSEDVGLKVITDHVDCLSGFVVLQYVIFNILHMPKLWFSILNNVRLVSMTMFEHFRPTVNKCTNTESWNRTLQMLVMTET